VVFKGGILGGAHQFWGNPYLNSMTVLFDKNPLKFSDWQPAVTSTCGTGFLSWTFFPDFC